MALPCLCKICKREREARRLDGIGRSCPCDICRGIKWKIARSTILTKKGGEEMLQVGNVVVVKATGVPARFKNIKPGALFKVVVGQNYAGGVTVGDHKNPSIRTNAAYFLILTQRDRDQIKAQGNTDLAVRVKAIEDFGPASTPDAGLVRVNGNGSFLSLDKDKGSALSKKNSTKLIQRKLARALNGR